MDSGIYKLTFASGNFYIGKSENIPKRWKTHETNFLKGTHTKKMQAEYDAYGPPTYAVFLTVHADHIDIYEGILIESSWGPNCLNATRPKQVPIEQSNKYIEYYDNITMQDQPIMLFSTLAHVEGLNYLNSKCNKLEEENDTLEAELELLTDSGIKLPEAWEAEYAKTLSDLADTQTLAREQTTELYRLSNLSLLERIFNYKVYV